MIKAVESGRQFAKRGLISGFEISYFNLKKVSLEKAADLGSLDYSDCLNPPEEALCAQASWSRRYTPAAT